ncbi:MAG: penicillin-insensitive murein endopeptidase [Paracoccaceae bacterium]
MRIASTWTALALGLALSACGGGPDTAPLTPTLSSQDTRLGKEVFGYIPTPSTQSPEAIGGAARGCMAGGVALPETGPTWQAMRLSRNRNWSLPVTVDWVQDLSRVAARQPGWAGLYVGDLSQPRGGPMTSLHRSHQSGLDVDVWLRPATDMTLSRQQREDLPFVSMRRAEGAFTNDRWTPQHEAILRAAAQDPRTARIFVFPGAKVAMCETATGDRSWLRKIRPYWGHHEHFHVRLNCPAGHRGCEDQAPPPPGDGCDEARGWVDRILNPPPPDPNAPAPTPRRELTMADLPAQCAAVAAN